MMSLKKPVPEMTNEELRAEIKAIEEPQKQGPPPPSPSLLDPPDWILNLRQTRLWGTPLGRFLISALTAARAVIIIVIMILAVIFAFGTSFWWTTGVVNW